MKHACPHCRSWFHIESWESENNTCPFCHRGLEYGEIEQMPENISEKLSLLLPAWKDWVFVLFFIVGLFLILPWIGHFFRKHVTIFLMLWLMTPACIYSFRKTSIQHRMSLWAATSIKNMALGYTVIFSILMFFSSFEAGDWYWEQYDSVVWRAIVPVLRNTNLFDNPLHWLFSMIFIGITIAVPVMTYSQSSRLFKAVEDRL